MMHCMCQFKPVRAVHQAVRPVKPGVVRKEIEENRKRQIPERVIADIFINSCPAPVLPRPHDKAGRYAVNDGTGQRPENLSPDLRFERSIKAGMAAFSPPCECPAGYKIADTDDDRHRKHGGKDGKEHCHAVGIRYSFVAAKSAV